MKCLILAGGQGTRMWPLSRRNYPKQFIQIQKNHSLFQETVSRNLPFCDEYIIITRAEYRFVIEDQMKAFQGTPYRCVYEEESRGTLQAIALACMDLVPSEFVFVVVSDHVIYTRPETGNGEMDYKDCVMQAKEYAREGNISLFTLRETIMNPRFGYVFGLQNDGSMDRFIEKPNQEVINDIDLRLEAVYRNLGMLLFEADVFLNEFRLAEPEEYAKCERVFAGRQVGVPLNYSIGGKTYDLSDAEMGMGGSSNYAYYSARSERVFDEMQIARNLLEKTRKLKAVKGVFLWSQIDTMEDIPETDIRMQGQVVTKDCYNTVVLNSSPNHTIVVNGLDNVMVANTPDAIYIGRYGKSAEIRDIVCSHKELDRIAEMGTVFYRPWGHFEQLVQEPGYRVRRVFVPSGHTIPMHSHTNRSKNIAVVQGEASIIRNGESRIYGVRSNIDLPAGCEHSITNAGEETLVFVETTVGDVAFGSDDTVPASDSKVIRKGYTIEPLISLQPAFKDYLWGGTKLRDIYGMNCDYDIIAEAWMMSAHVAGQSIVGSGEYRGMRFGDYLRGAGKEALGWKCSPLQNFPLLVKFIDARDNLSVQVHPNDDYALERENDYGKNEMWYVMAAEEGAGLYVGFNREVSAEEVEKRVKDNTIMEVLNFYPTKPGDVYYIPAGTVHAIGAGNLICEIQQSSNCTYRLYDFDRRDKFGNPRELHLKKALDVLNFSKYEPGEVRSEEDAEGTVISRCKYFEATVYEVKGVSRIAMDSSKFTSIICMNGSGSLEFKGAKLDIERGGSVFVPAMDGVLFARGDMTLILSHV